MTNSPTPPTAPEPNTQAEPVSPGSKPAAGLAISALIVGIVAFVSGWAPFWGIVAGLVAVILGALALRKGQSKGLALPGLILGALAALTSIVTTILMIAGLSLGSAQLSSATLDSNSSEASEAPAKSEEATAETGTRENPAALGTTLTAEDWTVVVNSVNPEGNQIVADGNMFNSEPDPGYHYAIVNYTVTYTGSESSYANFVIVDLVTSTGEVVSSAFATLDDSFGLNELYEGGTLTGSEAYMVEDGSTFTVRVTPGLFGDDTFFAVM